MRRLMVALWMIPALGLAETEGKVQVCHIPPGNPGNYHTITIPAPALKAHLAHGDLAGPCSDFCGTFCGDGTVCTQDAGTYDPATERCVCSNDPVDCSAGTPCLTAIGCDPALGCLYDVNVGTTCDADANACTGPDACDAAGACLAGPSIAGCCLSDAECPNDLCQHSECIANACTLPAPTPVAEGCTPANACWTAVCDAQQGCVEMETNCPATDGCHPGVCDPGTGACSNPQVPGCGCAFVEGERCYWMENTSGNYCSVDASSWAPTFETCRDMDSCSAGGGGASGGGCYKWADCSDCPAVPWPLP